MQNRPLRTQSRERYRFRDQVREVFCCGDGPGYTGTHFRQRQRPQSTISARGPFGLGGGGRQTSSVAYPPQPSMSMSQQPLASNNRSKTFSPPNSLAGQLPVHTNDNTSRLAAQQRPISLPTVPPPIRPDSRRATVSTPFTGQTGPVQGSTRPTPSLASTNLPSTSRRSSVVDTASVPIAQDVVMPRSVVNAAQQSVTSRRQSAMHQTAQTGIMQPHLSKHPKAATSIVPASSAGVTAVRFTEYSGGTSSLTPNDDARQSTFSNSQTASMHNQPATRMFGGNPLKPVRSPPNQAGLAEGGDLRTSYGSQASGYRQGQSGNYNDPDLAAAAGRRIRP